MVDRLSGKFGNYLVDRVSKKGIDVHLGEEVKKIGRKENKIVTQEGTYDYDNLVVATGSAKFRKDFGLNPHKSVVCTSIRVPKKELPDQRGHVGHCYLVKKSYYCGYTPMNNDVDFCQVFFNPTEFETESFFNRVKKIEGIDLSDYKMLVKPVHYGGDIARTKVDRSVWFIGDANGFGDIVGGLIGTCAYSGKVAALEIANKTAEANDFIKRFRMQYHGRTQILADLVKIYPNELNFLVPYYFDLIFSHKPLIKLIINRLGFRFITPEVAKKLLPLPGEEWKEFNREYYKKFLSNMIWKTFSHL
jgi:flavin-dependent dehydrogenase